MISLAPISDKAEIKRLFSENGLNFTENSGCVAAVSGGETLGYCLYRMDADGILIDKISPADDLSLADGILRSTLHVAAQRSIMNAFYSEETEALCERLNFIKNREEKRLDIDKLFKSCACCPAE